jgi:biotin operon repressor
VFVELSELRRKLGCSALQVWQALLLLRAADNTIHATRRGLGRIKGFAELPDRAVKKALGRPP